MYVRSKVGSDRPSPVPRGKPGSKIHAVGERSGLPLHVGSSAARVNDHRVLKNVVDGIRPPRQPVGRPRKRPAEPHGDKGYHSECCELLRERNIVARIARKGIESSKRLGRHRYVIARCLEWTTRLRRLFHRDERKASHFVGYLRLICDRRADRLDLDKRIIAKGSFHEPPGATSDHHWLDNKLRMRGMTAARFSGSPVSRAPRSDGIANREKVLTAARRALQRDVTAPMSVIAREAGVGVGTIYRHFRDRDALLVALQIRSIAMVLRLVDDVLERSPVGIDAVREFLIGTVRHGSELFLPNHGAPVTTDAEYRRLDQRVWDGVGRIVERGAADGTVRADATARDVIIFGSLIAVPIAGVVDWLEVAGRQIDFFVAAIRAVPAR